MRNISIVIPSFNQGGFIKETLDSIFSQSIDAEVIVIDGGSTDTTVEVLREYDSRIAYWESTPDRGQSHALNKGFARSSCDIMAWICADDLYLPGAFERTCRFFKEHPEAEFVYGDGFSIDKESNHRYHIKSGPVLDRKNFHNYNYVFSTTSFWKRSLWDKSGGYIDEGNFWTMDWELFIRMNKHAELHYLAGDVACLRYHEDAKTYQGNTKFIQRRNREIAKVSRKHGGYFCFNSRIHPLIRLTYLARFTGKLPRPLGSLLFRLLYFPLSLTDGNRHSIFFNGTRNKHRS